MRPADRNYCRFPRWIESMAKNSFMNRISQTIYDQRAIRKKISSIKKSFDEVNKLLNTDTSNIRGHAKSNASGSSSGMKKDSMGKK